MSRTRSGFTPFRSVVVTVGVVIGATAASNARAGDYQVAYAIDARGVRESGKYSECIYEKACRLNFAITSIRLLVNSKIEKYLNADRGQKYHFVLVSIHDSINCCYFSDGGDMISIDGDKLYHQLAIFEGRRRLGNEFVQNIKIGDIFLAFRDFR